VHTRSAVCPCRERRAPKLPSTLNDPTVRSSATSPPKTFPRVSPAVTRLPATALRQARPPHARKFTDHASKRTVLNRSYGEVYFELGQKRCSAPCSCPHTRHGPAYLHSCTVVGAGRSRTGALRCRVRIQPGNDSVVGCSQTPAQPSLDRCVVRHRANSHGGRCYESSSAPGKGLEKIAWIWPGASPNDLFRWRPHERGIQHSLAALGCAGSRRGRTVRLGMAWNVCWLQSPIKRPGSGI
jgi:hypothetical protein